MIKITFNIKNVIDAFMDIFSINRSTFVNDVFDLTIHKDISVDIKGNFKINAGVYQMDRLLRLYITEFSIPTDFTDDDDEMEIGVEYIYTIDKSKDGVRKDGKQYIYREPESLDITCELKPFEVKNSSGNFIHIQLQHILEKLYKNNSDILTEQQMEILQGFFVKHYPQIIINDISTAMIEPPIRTTFPDNYLSPTDKVSNSVYGLNINKPQLFFNESADIDVARKGIKGDSEVIVRAALELSKDSNIKGIEKLNLFDHRVHGAIGSWYYAGTTYITPQMIHHVITGDKNSRITDVQYQNIVDSVNLMREVRVTIDATAENEKYYPNSDKQSRFNGNIIDAIEFENIPLNGQLSSGFIIRGEPILFIYARQKKQLYDIPLNYLKSPVDKTKETIILHDYLLHRIEVMKNKNNNMSNVIVYNSIYYIMGEQNDIPFTKQKKERIRKYTHKILDDLISKGAIKKYLIHKENKINHSIEIIY